MVNRYLARDLANLQDRLVEIGIDEEEAERFVDDLEKRIEQLLASSELDTDDQDEEN